ncbi:ribonuclease P/MRP protein subunit Rpp1p [[Candida] jaroonii]|uniref:Ribonuclease P/MRP protein subunit Rpp1p n=1 Tax=[Candida] jaroonii TaxID=467808 RepID=A0ACA9Y8W4_9ASCO|nr:ribonuclease P/MRP protein subunit Rpp1p [[Candida] jaroonii]
MTCDLNLLWPKSNYDALTPSEITNIKNLIITSYNLGYYNVVINFEVSESLKLPINEPSKLNPIKIKEIIDISKFPDLKVFTRLTVIVNDSSKLINLNKYQNYFDLIAIKPQTEKSLQNSIINLNIDLISIPLDTKLNFYIKHKIVGKALEKGIKFEICYGPLISSTSTLTRKLMISNIVQLIRATRSNGLIISSGSKNPINLRSFHNIMNFFQTLGIKLNHINKFDDNAEKALINGRLRINSYKQTVMIDDNVNLYDNSKDEENNVMANNYKKRLNDEDIGQRKKLHS